MIHKVEDERMTGLVQAAVGVVHLDPVEAECAAYEAGRYAYGLEVPLPDALAGHPVLAQAFERGRADVPEDLAAEERAETIEAMRP